MFYVSSKSIILEYKLICMIQIRLLWRRPILLVKYANKYMAASYRIIHIPSAKYLMEVFKTKSQAIIFYEVLCSGWYFTADDELPYILTYGYRDRHFRKLKLFDDFKFQFEIVEEFTCD